MALGSKAMCRRVDRACVCVCVRASIHMQGRERDEGQYPTAMVASGGRLLIFLRLSGVDAAVEPQR